MQARVWGQAEVVLRPAEPAPARQLPGVVEQAVGASIGRKRVYRWPGNVGGQQAALGFRVPDVLREEES